MGECLILRSGGMDTSDATATEDKILVGYTAYVNDELITGTIPTITNVEEWISSGEVYTISNGYCCDATGIIICANSLEIETNGDAISDDILNGKTAWVNGSKITGTMVDNGTITQTIDPGGSYTIPTGYHSGSGAISVSSLSANTSANAQAAYIYKDKTAWVNGSKITGTMVDRGAVSQALAANGNYTIPVGYHNGNGKVTQSLTTQAATTVTPGTSNKTAVAAGRWTTGTITVAGSSSLVAANIKKGVNIFGVTGTFVGWVDNPLTIWNGSTAYYGCSINYNGTSKTSKTFNVIAPSIPITVKKVEVSGGGYYTGTGNSYEGEINVVARASNLVKKITIARNTATKVASVQVTNYAITDSNFLSVLNTGLAEKTASIVVFAFTVTGSRWDEESGNIGSVHGENFSLFKLWR